MAAALRKAQVINTQSRFLRLSFAAFSSAENDVQSNDKEPNISTVTPPITSWPQNLNPKRMLSLLSRVKDVRLALDIFTYAARYHVGYKHTYQTYYKMIEKLALSRKSEDLENVLQQLKLDDVKCSENMFIFVIRSYGLTNKPKEAMKVFSGMHEFRCNPSVRSFNTLLNAMVQTKRFNMVHSLYMSCRKIGVVPNVFTCNIILKALCQMGDLEAAYKVFDEMPKQGCIPNVVSYSTIMSCLCNRGDMPGAMRLFEEISSKGWVPDTVSYTILIDGYCKRGELQEAVKLMDHMEENGCPLTDITYGVVIEAYCKEGKLGEAVSLLDDMVDKKLIPSPRLCSKVVDGLCGKGKVEDAEELWKRLLNKNCTPDNGVYNTLIYWLCKKGRVYNARKLFDEMIRDCVPNILTYSTLINGLCEEGELQEACKLWDDMLEKGCVPNMFTYNMLINGFCKAAQHTAYNTLIGGIVSLSSVSEETEVPGIVNQLVVQTDCKDETRTKNVVETTNQKTRKGKQKAELDNSLEESNISWFGNVIGRKDGDIEVAWADGMVSKVGPHQILAIGKHERDAEQDKDVKVDPGNLKIADFPLVKWIANKFDVKLAKEEDTVVHNWSRSNWHEPGHFKHFDSVKNPLDHFYVKETGQATNMKQKWIKKVQQEWNILEKNLPDTIFVRIYEDRMDLLRAVIVGAAGTPYQDGLFFFDIHFPSKYPDVPPQAYYHSGGLRLNPNLYDDGKVCLSLLNTWMGKADELWNPSLSNVLQVLVSIQGLVLNDNPYFNEPSFVREIGSAEWEKNSLTDKENSFLLSCKSMLYILRKPPKHFEMLVKEHFKKRGHYILRACDAYLKGAPVGSLSEDCTLPPNVGAESQTQNSSCVGFKLMLIKTVPKLISAFMKLE